MQEAASTVYERNVQRETHDMLLNRRPIQIEDWTFESCGDVVIKFETQELEGTDLFVEQYILPADLNAPTDNVKLEVKDIVVKKEPLDIDDTPGEDFPVENDFNLSENERECIPEVSGKSCETSRSDMASLALPKCTVLLKRIHSNFLEDLEHNSKIAYISPKEKDKSSEPNETVTTNGRITPPSVTRIEKIAALPEPPDKGSRKRKKPSTKNKSSPKKKNVTNAEKSLINKCHECHNTYATLRSLKKHLVRCHKDPVVCSICGKKFTMNHGLKQHIALLHRGERSHKCQLCNELFPRSDALKLHLDTVHHAEKPHHCKVCQEQFSFLKDLKEHLSTHEESNSFICNLCFGAFKSQIILNEHKQKKHSTDKCHVCKKVLKSIEDRKKHKLLHMPQRVCDVCGVSFPRTSQLTDHIRRTHTKENPYKCIICGRAFVSNGEMNKHLRTHSTVKRHLCDICGKCFRRRDNLVQHFKHSHATDKSPGVKKSKEVILRDADKNRNISTFPIVQKIRQSPREKRKITLPNPDKPCTSVSKPKALPVPTKQKSQAQVKNQKTEKRSRVMKKIFRKCTNNSSHSPDSKKLSALRKKKGAASEKENLVQGDIKQSVDIIIHSSETSPSILTDRIKCEKCDATFESAFLLKKHLRVHGQPCFCTICGRKFSMKHGLTQHIALIHKGERSHKCLFCEKSFGRSDSLNLHLDITHHAEEPHRCTLCNDRFSFFKDYRRHVNNHLGRMTFSCSVCSKLFKNQIDLERHVFEKHPTDQCNFCGKVFESEKDRRLHSLTHVKQRVCVICHLSFPRTNQLMDHIRRSHTKEKPYKCETCGAAFISNGEMNRHKRTHSELKWHYCDLCGSDFRRSDGLRIHRKVKHGIIQ